MTMARTDNDSWEITESVGATALGVASSRAAETRSENPLITDPFAQVFIDAAGDGVARDAGHERRPDVALLGLHRHEAVLEHEVHGGRDAAEDGELRAALHNVRAQPGPRAHRCGELRRKQK